MSVASPFLNPETGEVRRIDQTERDLIAFALGHYGAQMSEVARKLGIGRSTLYRKIRDYQIAVPTTPPVEPSRPTTPNAEG